MNKVLLLSLLLPLSGFAQELRAVESQERLIIHRDKNHRVDFIRFPSGQTVRYRYASKGGGITEKTFEHFKNTNADGTYTPDQKEFLTGVLSEMTWLPPDRKSSKQLFDEFFTADQVNLCLNSSQSSNLKYKLLFIQDPAEKLLFWKYWIAYALTFPAFGETIQNADDNTLNCVDLENLQPGQENIAACIDYFMKKLDVRIMDSTVKNAETFEKNTEPLQPGSYLQTAFEKHMDDLKSCNEAVWKNVNELSEGQYLVKPKDQFESRLLFREELDNRIPFEVFRNPKVARYIVVFDNLFSDPAPMVFQKMTDRINAQDKKRYFSTYYGDVSFNLGDIGGENFDWALFQFIREHNRSLMLQSLGDTFYIDQSIPTYTYSIYQAAQTPEWETLARYFAKHDLSSRSIQESGLTYAAIDAMAGCMGQAAGGAASSSDRE